MPITATMELRRSASAGSTSLLNDAVVLAIDDGPANLLLLERLLTREGARVEGIADPRQAIAAYQRLEPDLILLDLHMPHMDGLTVLEAMQKVIPADSFVPVIVLTADTTTEARTDALAAGANDFLTKPFEHTEVLLRIGNLLRARNLHEQLRRYNQELQAEIRQREELESQEERQRDKRRRRIQQVLDHGELTMVFQPIVELRSHEVTGFEALARFTGEPRRPPNEWFADAAEVGLGVELELYAVRRAISQLGQLPLGTYLSVNVSPQTLLHPDLVDAIRADADRIVLELTEHSAIREYDSLISHVDRLRSLGTRIAVDDAGAGYASLQHVLRIRPDIIKLDIALTRGIHADPARRALGAALVQFGREINADITAEGIEEGEELDTLRRIGATSGQGYLLGRPAPIGTPAVI